MPNTRIAKKAAPLIIAASVASFSFLYTSRIIEDNRIIKEPNVVVVKPNFAESSSTIFNSIESSSSAFSDSTLAKAKKYLISKGFSRNEIDSIFSDGRLKKLPLFQKKAQKDGKRLTYEDYKKIFGVEKLSRKAVEFYKAHKKSLDSLSSKTNVPFELVLSILGMESNFGKNTGNYVVINTYLTLFENRPSKGVFALRQIESLLRISKKYSIDPFEIKGSHGGAIGPMQFIPTSIEKFDTTASFSSFVELVSVHNSLHLMFSYLRHSGASRQDGFRLGGANHKAAFDYNHSDYYARLAVELAEMIRKKTSKL